MMRGSFATFSVNHNNDLAVEAPEGDQPLLVVAPAHVLTGDREIVPDRLAANEVQAVTLDIVETLPFVPRSDYHIVVTIYPKSKSGSRRRPIVIDALGHHERTCIRCRVGH